MNTEEILRKKSAHYLPCFIKECPKHQTCLHWLTGEQTQDQALIITSVNPMNPNVKAGCCELYRENKTASYARGIMHMLDIIPYNQARSIKRRLIKTFSRKRYYEFRNGTRLISPEDRNGLPASARKKDGQARFATTVGKKIFCGNNHNNFIPSV